MWNWLIGKFKLQRGRKSWRVRSDIKSINLVTIQQYLPLASLLLGLPENVWREFHWFQDFVSLTLRWEFSVNSLITSQTRLDPEQPLEKLFIFSLLPSPRIFLLDDRRNQGKTSRGNLRISCLRYREGLSCPPRGKRFLHSF